MAHKKTFVCYILVFAFLTSCSSAIVRVMPGQNGIHKVIARDKELEDAEKAAHKAALEYCDDREPAQDAIFLKEKSKYTGNIDESTRNGVRTASKAISIIPGGSLIGAVANSSTDNRDYKAGVLFKCVRAN